MRDPKRINKIVKKLRELWLIYPDWRFFQLLTNIGFDHIAGDPFYKEDDELEKALDRTIMEVKNYEKN